MSNPLIAQPKETSAVAGVPLLEDATGLKDAIESKNWAAVAIGAVGTALDVLTAVMDPFGAIFAAGVGWLMEHVGPLKEALDALTGNADEIQAQAETWTNVAKELESVSAELTELVKKDLQDWKGDAADAYRKQADDTGKLIASAQKGSEGAASGVQTAGEIVAAVRSLVRDTIADLVGHLISWALQVVFTLGIGMTWVVPQVVSAVAKTASKITQVTTKLVKALKALMPLLKKVGGLFEDAGKALKGIKGGKAKPSPKPEVETPKGKPGGDSTKPSGDGGSPPKDKGEPPKDKDKDDSTGTAGADGPPKEKPKDEPADPSGKSDPPADKPAGSPPPEREGGGAGAGKDPADQDRSIDTENDRPRADDKEAVERDGCGDPIDIATGQMILGQVDVELAGVLPLVLSRTHLSTYRLGRSFGTGWACTVDQRIEIAPDGVHFAGEDGILLRYPVLPEAGAAVQPVSGPRWPLRRTDRGFAISRSDSGRMLHFVDDGSGRLPISGVTDGDGHQIDFQRAEDGTPVGIVHSAGYQLAIDTEDGLIRQFRLRTGEVEPPLVTFGYDGRRRLTEVVNSSGLAQRFRYDADGYLLGWEDRNGMSYRYRYDAEGRCVQTEGAGGYLSYHFDYDRENLVTRVTDSLGHVSIFELGEDFRVLRHTDPLGNTVRSSWDETGLLLSRTDPLGRTTRHTYDEAGRLVETVRPDGNRSVTEYNDFGAPVTRVDYDGGVWRWEYSPAGVRTAEIDPAGSRTGYARDERGRTTSVTDALGRTTRFEHDAAGLPVAVTDPLGAVTRYRYDPLGRPEEIIDPLGGHTQLAWSVEGTLVERVLPDGSRQLRSYDGEGNLRRAEDGEATTRTEIAHFDLPVSRTGPDGATLTFGYDTELRLTSVTNEQGRVWRYVFDPAGRLAEETDYDGRTTTFRYDAAGDLAGYTNGAGQTVRLVRDVLGRIVERDSDGVRTGYEYDRAGRVVRAVTPHTDLRIGYDAAGRVLSESVNGRVLASRYDAAGNRIWRRTPSGAESTWQYDQRGRPLSLRTGSGLLRFGYDAAGREVQRQLGQSVRLTQVWDETHQLRGQTLEAGPGRVLQQRGYEYREDGFLTGVQDRLNGPRQFDLDVTGRVTAVRGPGWSEQYAYAPTGDLLQAFWPRVLATNAETWATQQSQGTREYSGTLLERAGNVRYRHDGEGRIVRRRVERAPGVFDVWAYTWDAEDRLTGVLTPDGASWRYLHDGLGRRVAKQRLGGNDRVVEEVWFCWDGTDLVEQISDRWHALVWDWSPDGMRVLGQTERTAAPGSPGWVDQRFHAIVTDLVGAPAELVDADGVLGHQVRSTLWGTTPASAGETSTPLRFPGQYHDPETGLYQNFHRYYDPATGRYATHDRLGLVPGPNSRNYVPNPTAWTDPLGLALCDAKAYAEAVGDYRAALGWTKENSPHQLGGNLNESWTTVGVGKLAYGEKDDLKLVVDKANGYIVGYVKKGSDGTPDEIHHVAEVNPSQVAPGAVSKPFHPDETLTYKDLPNMKIHPKDLSGAVSTMMESSKGEVGAMKTLAATVAEGGRSNHYGKSVGQDLLHDRDVTVGTDREGLAKNWGTKSNTYRTTGDNPDNELALLNRPNDRPS
ncbi:RHS repeat-associated core domain-containing protein [Amycolatopsis jiangsuensis]|uniref:RHS repeat-associated protein n=1 Tax=Amycolatopsis jiangsuensis TaxID=1181879 RepID=A0A840IPG7_9PSEU|nr:RHS repeat-associated core domain-containing protein [Amycolatopsis jiangsuensis]MBB4683247.1 RHS repeat-associated protein [Amycolatopsis jiangsuensis]